MTSQRLRAYLSGLNRFDERTVEAIRRYMLAGREEVPTTHFVLTCKKIVTRETKSAEIAAVLARLKHSFVSRQVLVDDIYHILAKGAERLSVAEFRKSLAELKVHVTYEEFETLLYAFDINDGCLEAYNFYYVMKKVKLPREPPRSKQSVEPTVPPIALSPRRPRTVKCIILGDYLARVRSERSSPCSRPITTMTTTRRTPSSTTSRFTVPRSTDELLTERLTKYSKRLAPTVHLSSENLGSEPDQAELTRAVSTAPAERMTAGKHLLLASSPRTKAKQLAERGRSLGCWMYANAGKEFERLGRVEKDGVVTIKSATADGFWLKVECGKVEGWVQAPKVDQVIDRRVYSLYDQARVMVRGKDGKIDATIATLVTMRNAPRWDASSIVNLEIGRSVKVRSYVHDSSWAEIEVIIGYRAVSGWVPSESVACDQADGANVCRVRRVARTRRVHRPEKKDDVELDRKQGTIKRLVREKLEAQMARKARVRKALSVMFNWRTVKAFRLWRKGPGEDEEKAERGRKLVKLGNVRTPR